MSFLSVLKKIGSVALSVEHVAVPIIAGIDPVLAPFLMKIDGWAQRVQGLLLTAEANNPLDGQGAVKSQAVITDFEAGLDFTNSILSVRGKKLDYDKAALQDAISGFVAGYNGLAKVKASFKEVDL